MENEKNHYPKGLSQKKLKIAQKFLSIAKATKCKFLPYFYSFLVISKL
jgi:hypothetical protein